MKIRNLAISDCDQIVALWQKAKLPFKPEGRDRKDALQAEMAAKPDFFLGAFEADQLVGVIVATSDGRKGWINRLAVDPAYRRKGAAKALIDAAEKALRTHGIRIFSALIEDHNQTSVQLFRKCGYKEHRDIIYFSKRDSDKI